MNNRRKPTYYTDPYLLKDLYQDHISGDTERWLINTTIEPWYPMNVSSKGHVSITIPTHTTEDGTQYLLIRGQYIPLDYIIASTYLANPYDYTVVLHKDGDKSNCDILNLEWDTDPTHTAPSKPRHQVITELLSAGICPIPGTEDYLIYKAAYDLPHYSSRFNTNTGEFIMHGQENYNSPVPKQQPRALQTLEGRYNYIIQKREGEDADNYMEVSEQDPNNYVIVKHSVRYTLPKVKAEQLVESLEENWRNNNPMEAILDEFIRGSFKGNAIKKEFEKYQQENNHNDSIIPSQDSEQTKNYNDSSMQSTEDTQENHNNSSETVQHTLTQREMMEKLRQTAISKQAQTDSAPVQTAGEAFGFSTTPQSEQSQSSRPVSLTSLANQDQYGQATVITTQKHQSDIPSENHNNSFEPVFDTTQLNHYNSFSQSTVQYTQNHNDSIIDEETRAQSQAEIDQMMIDTHHKFYFDPVTNKFASPPVDKDGNKIYTVPKLQKHKYNVSYYTDDINNMMTDEEARARGLAFAPPIPPEMRADILICDKIKQMKDNFTRESNGGSADLQILRENMKTFREIPYSELLERGLRTPHNGKPVSVIMRNGEEKIFNSVSEAATMCNVTTSDVTNCCRGKRPDVKGLRFKYIDPRDINKVFQEYISDVDGKLSKNITDLLESGKLEMTPELEFIIREQRKSDEVKKRNDERSQRLKEEWDKVRKWKELEAKGELYDKNGNPVMEEPKYLHAADGIAPERRSKRRTREQIAYDREHDKHRPVGRPKGRKNKKKPGPKKKPGKKKEIIMRGLPDK